MSVHALRASAEPAPPAPPDSPDAWEYGLQLPNDPRVAGIARHTVRIVLNEHGLPRLAEEAQLLTSELVTNALCYSDGAVFVRMRWNGESLRVCVWDTNPELPTAGTPGPHDLRGRGLFLVRRLSSRWGQYDFADKGGGKAVWFEMGSR